jgi:PDZ domain-containing protein
MIKKLKYTIPILLLIGAGFIPTSYSITTPGGANDVGRYIQSEEEAEHTYSLTYVYIYDASFFSYLFTTFTERKVYKTSEKLYDDETKRENKIRGQLTFRQSKDFAILNAYRLSDIDINESHTCFIGGRSEEYKLNNPSSNLEVGDELYSINGIPCSEFDEMIQSYQPVDLDEVVISFDGGEETVQLYQKNGENKVGVIIMKDFDYDLDVDIDFDQRGLTGPSAGLLMALHVYDVINPNQFEDSLHISGSATIDEDGNLGPIGSVNMKILSAEKEGADIFFAHSTDYEEAIEIKKQQQLEIEVVSVETFEDAVRYLEQLN